MKISKQGNIIADNALPEYLLEYSEYQDSREMRIGAEEA